MPRYTPETRLALLDRLRNGATIAAVVRDFGVPRFTVYRWIRKAKLDLEAIAKVPYEVGFDRAAMRRRFEEGAKAREVAEEFGCSLRYAYAVRSGELE
ncbi:MAG: helix-turn-helix domain-containing protein [Nannocystaceae bacterium]